MKKFLEISAVLSFLLISSSASFAASGQIQGPGSLFFVLLTCFLAYCSLLVGLQLTRTIRLVLKRP
ncbi:hypothetical protein SAMN05660860_02521 [Geoalkalibacter ferrihydriticus]|uniref:CcmD family protein n=2 Tax=Geoalkalibacter ferrihydriticus TaxID=392333 RepID=A0A0C2EC47_9BACT|nr:hypothetical protein [Geoalkalibacter ferrihydriticus]KIH76123.1 hypothetical protein GFER_12900 [Geoalkalibacter ferrihydriticus DSM 17813]SDM44002.1 hypothetical protein SAMN05660860_02521 [Geoalkalibacter ferrihydriticus]